jgi:mannose-6-phosphate isomerase-like protein (cupin superfamily)
MQRVTLVLLAILFVARVVAFSQDAKPSAGATYLSLEDQQALWKLTTPDKNRDQGAMVVGIGPYNIGINVQHRINPNEAPNGRMSYHSKVTEIYYVTQGTATLETAGGPMTDPKPSPNGYSAEEVVKTNGDNMAGPGGSALFAGPHRSLKVKPGDVIVLPPNTGHYLSQVSGSFHYLVFRVDPDHVLPTGFINKYVKK